MEFRQSIKQLKKQYYNILKQYYSTNKLILKMIAMHNSSELSEPEICFMTCDTHSFSDKYINKLYTSNPERAIRALRVRSVCCIQTMQAIDNIIINCTRMDDKGIKFIQDLKAVRDKLYDLAQCSINQSNKWAKENKVPYISIDEHAMIRHYKYDNEEFNDFDTWNIDNIK